MAATSDGIQAEALANYRRDNTRLILLPFGVGAAVLIVALLVTLFGTNAGEKSVVSDFLMTILLLCPAVLCTLPLAILLVVAAFAMNRVEGKAISLFDKVVPAVEGFNRRIDRAMDRLGRNAVDFGVKAAPVEKLVLSAFDRTNSDTGQEAKHDQSNSHSQP
jgi:hypothetical protein